MIQGLQLTSVLFEGKIDLDFAYTFCANVTREHSKSFYFSTQFLPAEKHRAFYAFCRATDDMVDLPRPGAVMTSDLAEWRRQSRLPGSAAQSYPVGLGRHARPLRRAPAVHRGVDQWL